jgi:4-alpha-glucanotransferase
MNPPIEMETHNPGESTPNRPAILSGGKKAGVGMHFSSLCGPYGIGDIGDSALAFVDSLNRMKIDAWQFPPTGPTAYGDSPYQPLSAFAGNEMLIGIEPLIRLGLVRSSEAEGLAGLPRAWVDYGKLIPRIQALLNRAAGRFIAGGLLQSYNHLIFVNQLPKWSQKRPATGGLAIHFTLEQCVALS